MMITVKYHFDLMFHGFDYPDELGKNELHARFWRPKMVDGKLILFGLKMFYTKVVRSMKANQPESVGLEEEGLLEGFEEWEGHK